MNELARLYQASAHHLPMMTDKSAQCVVTSPPYFGLRKYEGEQNVEWGEVSYSPMAGLPPIVIPAMTCPLGNESTIESFVGHLVLCAREWRRILKDDGVMFVNLGDSYSGSNGNGYKQTANKVNRTDGGEVNFSLRREINLTESIPPKNLMMVPQRFALAMQADGWILRSEIIWAKGVSFCESYSGSVMPESVSDRPTRAHEQIYMFAKSPKYYCDMEAIREPAQDWGNRKRDEGKYTSTTQGFDNPQNGLVNGDFSERGRNVRDVWTINPGGYREAHFATFPEKLIEPMIKAGSREGDMIFDPFSGSGTTGRVSIRLGRKYIGTDLSESYLRDLSPERLKVQQEMTL